MTVRSLSVTTARVLFLLIFFVQPSLGQQPLPFSGHDVSSLIQVLNSDSPDFEKAKACQQLAIVGDDSAVSALAALLSDDQLSTYARSALENMPGDDVDEALRLACSSLKEKNLLGVIQSLGKRQSPNALPALAKHLDSDDSLVCIAASRAIGQIGTAQAASLLERVFSGASGELQQELGKAVLICAQRLTEQRNHKNAEGLSSLFWNLRSNTCHSRTCRQNQKPVFGRAQRYAQVQ